MMPESSDSGMDDSLYADEGAKEETTPEESVDEESAENPTALLPISALGKGAKVGDTITLKVLKLHDDEAEVEIAQGGDDKETETISETEEEPDTDAMMEA